MGIFEDKHVWLVQSNFTCTWNIHILGLDLFLITMHICDIIMHAKSGFVYYKVWKSVPLHSNVQVLWDLIWWYRSRIVQKRVFIIKWQYTCVFVFPAILIPWKLSSYHHFSLSASLSFNIGWNIIMNIQI